MMKYGVRVALGALVGLALAVGLTLWLDRWWVGALAGGLGGPVVFLATFFLWTADRPEEGYEQVLFDRPNTLLGAVMLVAFVGVAFGSAWFFSGPSGPTPEEAAALAKMEESHATLQRLEGEYATASEARAKGGDPGDLAADLSEAQAAKAAVEAIEAPESLAARKDGLLKAAAGLVSAFGDLKKCADGEEPACVNARFGHADAVRGLQNYAEAGGG